MFGIRPESKAYEFPSWGWTVLFSLSLKSEDEESYSRGMVAEDMEVRA